jgi:hypothetical protein
LPSSSSSPLWTEQQQKKQQQLQQPVPQPAPVDPYKELELYLEKAQVSLSLFSLLLSSVHGRLFSLVTCLTIAIFGQCEQQCTSLRQIPVAKVKPKGKKAVADTICYTSSDIALLTCFSCCCMTWPGP